MSKRIFILGSTGSIGRSTVRVIEHLQAIDGEDAWNVVGLSAHSNVELLCKQATELNVNAISISEGLPHEGHSVFESSLELIRNCAKQGDLVVAAIVGFAGIEPVLEAIRKGCNIALANKESLVAAGQLITHEAQTHGVEIIPIDSEHSAIFQSLQGASAKDVQKITLTASGGSLRELSDDQMQHATVEQVLNHPTWDMGAKVTVDSASLMNKALELIEAHWLFNVSGNQLRAVIHPQSIIHGLVEFIDGSTIAQLSPPDMCFPIQYALTYPHRAQSPYQKIDWSEISQLDFQHINTLRYPAIDLAYEVIRTGGIAGAVMNAANEEVVASFLQRKLAFGSMVGIVRDVMNQFPNQEIQDFQTLREVDQAARAYAHECVNLGLKST